MKDILAKLSLAPSQVLRKRDPSYKKLGLSGKEPDDILIAHLAENPTLLDRPIGVLGKKAVVGRPPDRLLELLK